MRWGGVGPQAEGRPTERRRSAPRGLSGIVDVYDRLGVRKRINGAGLLTRLGGSLMDPEVLKAMAEAAGSFVDMAELQAAASRAIAAATGAEAGLVTTGAAAALTLGTA